MSDTVPEHVAEAVEEGVPKRLHRRGRFIPAAKEHLIALLAEHVAPDDRAAAQFREVCRLIDEAQHDEARERLVRLKQAYAGFDPDADVALAVLTDLEFGDWALEAWPALSDAVLDALRA